LSKPCTIFYSETADNTNVHLFGHVSNFYNNLQPTDANFTIICLLDRQTFVYQSPKLPNYRCSPMESGASGNMESKTASAGDEAMPSPVLAAGGRAGEDEEVAVPLPPLAVGAGDASTPAPAAAASPRPYYECVFCKRGFTTAQALGGHMNIHRRDRAKPAGRDSSPADITTVSRNVECYSKYRHLLGSYPPIAQLSSIPIPIPISAGSSFGMYDTSSSAAAGARLDAEGGTGGNPNSVSPRELSLFGNASRDQDYLHLGLGRHGHMVGEGSRALAEGSSSERQESGEPERELDLELRLGRRPTRH
jgi:hypothetical protein